MSTLDNLFQLRFYGENITPKSFSIKETGDLLVKIEDSIHAFIEEKYINVDKSDIHLSLIEVQDKSNQYDIFIKENVDVTSAIIDWGKSISDNSYVNFPKAAQSGIEKIFNLTHLKNCQTEFKHKDIQLAHLTPNDEFIKQEKIILDINCNIYGELVKIGDEKPKIWIKLFNDEIKSVEVTKEIVKQLSSKMYSPIAFSGKKRINILTNETISLKLLELIEYNPYNASKSFNDLKEISNGFWDKFKTQEEISTYLIDG